MGPCPWAPPRTSILTRIHSRVDNSPTTITTHYVHHHCASPLTITIHLRFPHRNHNNGRNCGDFSLNRHSATTRTVSYQKALKSFSGRKLVARVVKSPVNPPPRKRRDVVLKIPRKNPPNHPPNRHRPNHPRNRHRPLEVVEAEIRRARIPFLRNHHKSLRKPPMHLESSSWRWRFSC